MGCLFVLLIAAVLGAVISIVLRILHGVSFWQTYGEWHRLLPLLLFVMLLAHWYFSNTNPPRPEWVERIRWAMLLLIVVVVVLMIWRG